VLPFSSPDVRALVHEAKFYGNRMATELLGEVLLHHFSTTMKNDAVVIPMPLSRARMRARGYNQVVEIARIALKSCKHMTVMENVLVRIRDTKPQTELVRGERTNNVANAFACLPARQGIRDVSDAERILKNAHVILLDDVVTTGSTMKAAKSALSKCRPASITCVALAH
jgi:predicted amidophosphoribosyltransferase